MKKQIYSFLLVLMGVFAYAVPVCAQENNDEPEDALEKAEAKKFRGLDYEVPELSSKLKDMADDYLLSVKNADNAKASRQLVVLMDTIMKKPFRQRVDGLVSVGHYFVQNRSEKAAVLCRNKIVEMDKAPTMRYTLLFCAEASELVEDYGNAANFYDEVNYLDENDLLAFNRKAYLNKFIRQDFAIENYKKLLTLNPGEYNAYKHIGDIYFNQALREDRYMQRRDSFRAEAIENYRLYFEAAPKTEGAIEFRACQRYVSTMYDRQAEERHKDNDSLRSYLRNEARRVAQLALDLKIAPSPNYERIMHYYVFRCDLDNKNYDLANQSKSYVTNKLYPDSLYSAFDYLCAAELETQQEHFLEAIPYYDIVIERYPKYIFACSNVVKIYKGLKRPLDAVPYQEKLMASFGPNRLPETDKVYAELFKEALKLTKDSVEIDSLKKRIENVYNASIDFYTQRLTIDSVKNDTNLSLVYYEGLKTLYEGAGRAEEALPIYAKYFDLKGEDVNSQDIINLARLYARVIKADTLKREEFLPKADSLFAKAAVLYEKDVETGRRDATQLCVPWFERAGLWAPTYVSNLDLLNQTAADYYMKACDLIDLNACYSDKDLMSYKISSARYPAIHHLMLVLNKESETLDEEDVKNLNLSQKYVEIILELDFNDSNALTLLDVIDQQKKLKKKAK